MIIRRVTVADFGVLRGPLTVELGPGVNVISGPNRIGKSTLMRAIHSAMTLRGKITGAVRDRFVPYGGGTPEVTLLLEEPNRSLTVSKRFAGQTGATSLMIREQSGASRQLQGAEADETFYDIMGIRPAGRGAPGDELCGVWPLVWIEQGSSSVDPSRALNTDTRARLRSLLEEETGVALGGAEAARIYERVNTEYNRYYTVAGRLTLSAGSPYADAKRAFEEGTARLSELRGREETHAGCLNSYSRVCGELERLDAEIPSLRQAVIATDEHVRRIADLTAAVERADSASKLAQAEFNATNSRCVARRQLRADVESVGIALAEHRATTERHRLALDAHRGDRRALDTALATAQVADRESRASLRRLELDREARTAREQLQTVVGQLEAAAAQERVITTSNEELARLGARGADIAEVRRLSAQVDLHRAALEAAAARVRVKSLGTTALRADSEDPTTLGEGDTLERLVSRPTTFYIGTIAEVEVTPGGADLSTLESRLRVSTESFVAQLKQSGATSLMDAEVRESARVRLKAEADTALAILAQVAPEGLSSLERRAAEARGTIERLDTELGTLPEAGEQARDSDARSVETQISLSKRAAATAVSRLRDCERAVHSHETTERSLESAAALSKSAAEQAETQLQTLTERLNASVRELGDDTHLEQARVAHAQTLTTRGSTLDAASRALAVENPEDARRTHSRAAAGLAEAEQRRLGRMSERDRLEGQLSSGDLAGLHERRGDAEAAESAARRAFEQQNRYARSIKLLRDTLNESRTQTQQAFREPLMRRLVPLLQSLHPGASAELDDEFNIIRFNRPGVGQDEFGALSGGESEQFGLVVRLALAQVMAQEQPLPVMVDDGLVHTDDHRMRRLLDILSAVGNSLQLIICTCHPESYRGLARAEQCIDLESRVGANA